MIKLTENDVTPHELYVNRRKWLGGMLALAGLAITRVSKAEALNGFKLTVPAPDHEEVTSFKNITTYNNFYEYGEAKEDPSKYAPNLLKTKPWSIAIEGACAKPATVGLEDLIKPYELEERIYRHRCVEAWSMVIPWIGVPLHKILKRFEPTSAAKYVVFYTLHDPKQMPGQRGISSLDWPYVESFRIDEAMHPLSLLSVGLYGQNLLAQNGAPVRLTMPWKYGLKNIKSIVKIRFSETLVPTSWMKAAPNEYGFYSNVNPNVDHPRWSQATERRIGEFRRRKTLMFNGYADQVASLYTGLDLQKNF